MVKQPKYLNLSKTTSSLESEISPGITNSTENDFFKDTNPSKIFLNKSQERIEEINYIIDVIRETYPISIWDLCKKINVSHSKLYYILRDLEFAGVILSKVKLNDNNRSVRIIYISNKLKESNKK